MKFYCLFHLAKIHFLDKNLPKVIETVENIKYFIKKYNDSNDLKTINQFEKKVKELTLWQA